MSATETTAPGDSRVQREAEAAILRKLSERLGLQLAPKRVDMGEGVHVDLDGACLSSVPAVLVEAWAHQGPPKSAQKHKVMTDALRLLWVERSRFPGARKILAFADNEAAAHFMGDTWMASALRDLGIELLVVELPDETRLRIRGAQAIQYR